MMGFDGLLTSLPSKIEKAGRWFRQLRNGIRNKRKAKSEGRSTLAFPDYAINFTLIAFSFVMMTSSAICTFDILTLSGIGAWDIEPKDSSILLTDASFIVVALIVLGKRSSSWVIFLFLVAMHGKDMFPDVSPFGGIPTIDEETGFFVAKTCMFLITNIFPFVVALLFYRRIRKEDLREGEPEEEERFDALFKTTMAFQPLTDLPNPPPHSFSDLGVELRKGCVFAFTIYLCLPIFLLFLYRWKVLGIESWFSRNLIKYSAFLIEYGEPRFVEAESVRDAKRLMKKKTVRHATPPAAKNRNSI